MTDNIEEEGLSSDDYRRAIDVQDACNLSGVVHTLSRVMTRVWVEARRLGKGTDWVNGHPIAVMYSSKIASLTGSGVDKNFSESYDFCREKAGPR